MAFVSTPGFVIDAGLVAHLATVATSESQRQSDIGVAAATYAGLAANYAVFLAAVKTADLAHLRRLAASALTNSVNVNGSRDELRRQGG